MIDIISKDYYSNIIFIVEEHIMNIRMLFISLFSVVFLTFSTAHAQNSPEEFVISLMKEASELSKLPEDTRELALLNLVKRGFNIPLVGRFVLGKYWRKATPKQKHDFIEVFEKAAVRSFSPLLSDVPLDTFKIIRVTFKNTNNNDVTKRSDILVFSTIEIENRGIIKLTWLIRFDVYQGYKIINITAEGISLVVTMRAEYSSFVKNNGGTYNGIDNLIAELRRKAN